MAAVARPPFLAHVGSRTAVLAVVLLPAAALSSLTSWGTRYRVTVPPPGAETGLTQPDAPSSRDGRFVAFSTVHSYAAQDTNDSPDVYVRDVQTGAAELISAEAGGGAAAGESLGANISGNGRFVVFTSRSPHLVSGGPASRQVYLRDRELDTTELVSVNDAGHPADGDCSGYPGVSADGRYVVFAAAAGNLVSQPVTPGRTNVYLRDRELGVTRLAGIAADGGEPDSDSHHAALAFNAGVPLRVSDDGRFVMWDSLATNVIPGNAFSWYAYLRDMTLTVNANILVGTVSALPRGWATLPAGAPPRVLTWSVAGLALHHTGAGVFTEAAILPDGTTVSGTDLTLLRGVGITADGRFCAFRVAEAAGGGWNTVRTYLRDLALGATEQVDEWMASTGQLGQEASTPVHLALGGRYLGFTTLLSLHSGDGNTGFDAYVLERPRAAIAVPVLTGARDHGTGRIHLSWNDPYGSEQGFQIYRWDGAAYQVVHTTGPGVTAWCDGAPPTDRALYYVRAFAGTEQGAPSNKLQISTPPATPTGLTATGVSGTRIRLQWQDNSTTETGFRVERDTGGGSWEPLATVGAGKTLYNHDGLTPGVTQTYRVVAVNAVAGLESPPSNTAAGATLPELPAAPSDLTAAMTGPTTIRLVWTDNSAPPGEATGFRVYRSTAGDAYELIATLGAVTACEDGERTPGVRYVYYVTAFNARGTSRSSNKASLTLPSL